MANGVLGPLRFDSNGDLTNPAIMILRVERRLGASDVETYEGAAVDRVIRPVG